MLVFVTTKAMCVDACVYPCSCIRVLMAVISGWRAEIMQIGVVMLIVASRMIARLSAEKADAVCMLCG